jgi:hypothetical protein
MLDLRDKPLPEDVDNIPGIRSAHLRDAQLVDRTARIFLRADIDYTPAVTGDNNPHRCTYKQSLLAARHLKRIRRHRRHRGFARGGRLSCGLHGNSCKFANQSGHLGLFACLLDYNPRYEPTTSQQ